jgi:Protein of unknown function (DUF1501)
MLRILGSHKRFCDGLSRRDLLHIGSLAPLGLSLANTHAVASSPRPNDTTGFGTAKRCIFLYLWGSPSQIDTFDPKPDAPAEIRGPLGSIPSVIPGVRVGEIFPRIAKLLDRVTIVRSMTHPYPIHGTSFATTAVPTTDLLLEGRPREARQWPFMGSVVDFVSEQRDPTPPSVPRNYWLPFLFGSKRGNPRSGPFGGFLGKAYDPSWAEFRAVGQRKVPRDSGAGEKPTPMIPDPYVGILPTDRFETSSLPSEITLDRMNERMSLLQQLDTAIPDRHQQLAFSVLTSGKLRTALDIQQEPLALRERYGMTLFGQSCLAARRVLEAGGKFVTVCWDEYGLVNTGWDTHVYMKSRLKDELGPGLDNGFATLLDDLQARGMLKDTAIVVMSEHGRTPKVQNVTDAGRDHWSGAYSAVFAGGGFGEGRVLGRTDKHGGHVMEKPFSPKDIVATIFHLLGIDPQSEIHDKLGRPYVVGGVGQVRRELLA